MKRAVLRDSSAILALLDADDADHGRAAAIARRIVAEQYPSFITNYIEAEAHALRASDKPPDRLASARRLSAPSEMRFS